MLPESISPSILRSAVYYVVRVVGAPDLEASGGAFVPVEVLAPKGCLVNASFPAAVVAGNTETSSRIVDVVMAAQQDLVEPLARFDPRLVKMAPSGEPPED